MSRDGGFIDALFIFWVRLNGLRYPGAVSEGCFSPDNDEVNERPFRLNLVYAATACMPASSLESGKAETS